MPVEAVLFLALVHGGAEQWLEALEVDLPFSHHLRKERLQLLNVLRDDVGGVRLSVATGQLLHRVLVSHSLARVAVWAASARFNSRFNSTRRGICFSFAAAARRWAISSSSRAY